MDATIEIRMGEKEANKIYSLLLHELKEAADNLDGFSYGAVELALEHIRELINAIDAVALGLDEYGKEVRR